MWSEDPAFAERDLNPPTTNLVSDKSTRRVDEVTWFSKVQPKILNFGFPQPKGIEEPQKA